MRSRLAVVMAFSVLGVSCSSLRAEYRVALLIDNSRHQDKSLATPPRDLKALAESLREQQGFRCEIVEDLEEKELQRAIEKFAKATPVRSTTLIYFAGPVSPGSSDGQPTATLLGIRSNNGKGYDLASVFENLHTQGGSWANCVVLDCANVSEQKFKLPERSLLAFAEAKTLQATGDLLLAIEAGGTSVQSSLPEDFKIEGPGSQAITPPDEFRAGMQRGEEWVNSRGMVFCWCPPGEYIAGSPEDAPGRYPDEAQKTVTIEDGFWISKYEVTLGQWRGNRHRESLASDKLHPINMASQSKDTKAREINPLNKSEWQADRLPKDWEYALPTEEQWEYAARAGTTTRFYFGEDPAQLPLHANFSDKSHYDTESVYSNSAHRLWNDGTPGLARVGSYKPNPWGLHDVYGNVAEWCDNAVVRGGAWVSVPDSCRSAYRDPRGDRDQENYIGCRFVIQKRRDKKN